MTTEKKKKKKKCLKLLLRRGLKKRNKKKNVFVFDEETCVAYLFMQLHAKRNEERMIIVIIIPIIAFLFSFLFFLSFQNPFSRHFQPAQTFVCLSPSRVSIIEKRVTLSSCSLFCHLNFCLSLLSHIISISSFCIIIRSSHQ